jgi:hypothetical protein
MGFGGEQMVDWFSLFKIVGLKIGNSTQQLSQLF